MLAHRDAGHDAMQSLDADFPGEPPKTKNPQPIRLELACDIPAGRLFLEPASTEARSLEGRPLTMYNSLTFPDRSRLRLSEPAPRLAAAFDEQRRPSPVPMSAVRV